jgi:hypothetical protein
LERGGPQDRGRDDATEGSERFASRVDSPKHASRHRGMVREKASVYFGEAVGPCFFVFILYIGRKACRRVVGVAYKIQRVGKPQ